MANPLYPFLLDSGPGWVRISLPDGYNFYVGGGAGWVKLADLSIASQGAGFVSIRPQLIIPDVEMAAGQSLDETSVLSGVPTHHLQGSFRISTDRWPVFQGLTRGSKMLIKVPPILFRGQYMLPSPLGESFVVEYDGRGWFFKPKEEYQASPLPLHLIPTPFRYAATLIRPDGSTVGPMEFKVEDGEALFVNLENLNGQSDTITSSLQPYLNIVNAHRLNSDDDTVNRAVYKSVPNSVEPFVDLSATLMTEHLVLRLREYPGFFIDRSPLYVRVPEQYPFEVDTGTLLDRVPNRAGHYYDIAVPASTRDWLWLLINSLKRYQQFSDAASLQVAHEIVHLMLKMNVVGNGFNGVPHADGHWHVFPRLEFEEGKLTLLETTYSLGADQALAAWAFLLMHAITENTQWKEIGLGLFKTVLDGLAAFDQRNMLAFDLPYWASDVPYHRWVVGAGPDIDNLPLDTLLEHTLMLTQAARIVQDLHLAKTSYAGHSLFERLDRLWAFWGRYKHNGGLMPRGIPYTHVRMLRGNPTATIYSAASKDNQYQPWRIAKIAWAIGEAVSAGITTDHPVTLIERLYGQSLKTHIWAEENQVQDGISDLPLGQPFMRATIYLALARQTLRDVNIRTSEIIANAQAAYAKPF